MKQYLLKLLYAEINRTRLLVLEQRDQHKLQHAKYTILHLQSWHSDINCLE